MTQTDIKITKKLAAITAGFSSEGWRLTGSMTISDQTTIAMKHTNGNRLSIIATPAEIAIIINGHIRKREPVTCHPVHVENPK